MEKSLYVGSSGLSSGVTLNCYTNLLSDYRGLKKRIKAIQRAQEGLADIDESESPSALQKDITRIPGAESIDGLGDMGGQQVSSPSPSDPEAAAPGPSTRPVPPESPLSQDLPEHHRRVSERSSKETKHADIQLSRMRSRSSQKTKKGLRQRTWSISTKGIIMHFLCPSHSSSLIRW